MIACAALLALLPLAFARPELYERNLNYRSPYANQPGFGRDVAAVHKRQHLAARSHLRKRAQYASGGVGAEQQASPDGDADNYTYKGYGLGVVDYQNAEYVYAGGLNFTHSVASGDPYDYSVLLWTRAVPTATWALDVPMCLEYKVYSGENATGNVVSSGYALASEDVDFTFKVEADGLQADTWYWYQFANCANPSEKSPVGRTRTAPGYQATNIGTQRFSIYSCSNYPNGFFNSYGGPVVHQDTDYVVHVGDYIYESGTGGKAINRVPSKGLEIASLDDYRRRYDEYRTDIDLQSMHAQFPIIAIWDDHETADNDWKAGSAHSNDSIATGGCAYSNGTVCFSDREAHAKRAYHEWIPIRAVDISDESRIWRQFNFGDLLDVFALDTRKYDRDITDVYYNTKYVQNLGMMLNTSRSIIGPKQEKWFLDGLSQSQQQNGGKKWKMVLNQVLMSSFDNGFQTPGAPVQVGNSINNDAWDGYQAVRARVVNHVHDNSIDNVAVFTGDSHAYWLFETNPQTILVGASNVSTLNHIRTTTNSKQQGQIIEFGGTAVSSSGWGNGFLNGPNATIYAQRGVEQNPSLLYSEGFYRGYMHVAVNYTHMVTSYYSYPGNQQARVPNNRTLGAQFVVENGMNQVQRPLKQPLSGFGAIKPGNF